MSSRRPVRQLVVAILCGVLVGGGLMAVTPAGAEVSQAVATNWKKIWKKNLKPLADKRYYTKAQSNTRYQPKGSYETAGSGYTKAESDAKYAGTGSSYSKAESDAKYAPYPTVIRGTYALGGTATAAGQPFADSIAWGFTAASAPTVHYINNGAAVPAGCSGTVAAPNASAGNLCVFEAAGINVTTRDIDNASGTHPQASPFGANIWAYSTAAGQVYVYGSFALRPAAPVSAARVRPTPDRALGGATGR
jgi:hypothetical protein